MKWIKIEKRVTGSGATTITYRLEGTPYTVESRKRPIPHANRAGSWSFTSYFVHKDGVEVVEKHTLKAAKEYAEALYANVREVAAE
ncbi:MAG: hypothetical protein J6Q14_01240 [Oscillospiraceae bacterium]|nr:hypothetical protein [Oscillospiraceae bacterium]